MKGRLHDIYLTTDHEQSLTNIAYDLFNEMYNQCLKAARYGRKSIKVRLTDLPTYRWIETANEREHVEVRLLKFIREEGLLGSVVAASSIYELSWGAAAPLDRIPIVRTSDLIDAGYPVNEEKYGIILRELKRAILEGHVPGKTLQAELLWIKGAFLL